MHEEVEKVSTSLYPSEFGGGIYESARLLVRLCVHILARPELFIILSDVDTIYTIVVHDLKVSVSWPCHGHIFKVKVTVHTYLKSMSKS